MYNLHCTYTSGTFLQRPTSNSMYCIGIWSVAVRYRTQETLTQYPPAWRCLCVHSTIPSLNYNLEKRRWPECKYLILRSIIRCDVCNIQGYPQRMRLWRQLETHKFSLLSGILFFYSLFNDLANKKVTVVENRRYKNTDSINPVQSSLKSHTLWVTLYNPTKSIKGKIRKFLI